MKINKTLLQSKYRQLSDDKILEGLFGDTFVHFDCELPCQHQHGDSVLCNFGEFQKVPAKVTKISFTHNKVFYDLELIITTPSGKIYKTRIHSIEGDYVDPIK